MTTVKLVRSAPARASVVGRLVPSDRLRSAGVDRPLLKRLGFSGAAGTTATTTGEQPSIAVVVGVGPSSDLTPAGVRRAAACFVRAVAAHKSVVLDLGLVEDLGDTDELVAAAAEGVTLGAYRFGRHRRPSDDPTLESVNLVCSLGGKDGLARGHVIADAVCFARDLVNEPGGTLTPTVFADRAAERATAAGLTVEVMDLDAITEARLGGLIGVNLGSVEPPRFVKLTYEPDDATGSVALVGKGITFDSGGLSIKPADGMMTMKCDMAGAAAVIATMCALPALGVRTKVTSYTPMTDNMTGGAAQRPGDVLTARNGTTVEVLNTDAEGRLVLADALALASEDAPDAIVDLATLTGACMVALGDRIAGVLANDEALSAEILEAADGAGEGMWPLPLPKEYRKLIDSQVADIKNIGGRYGGTLTAGLFLQEFVGEGIPWAHLDIAGPAFSEEVDAEVPKGGTGFGVRTLIDWLSVRGESGGSGNGGEGGGSVDGLTLDLTDGAGSPAS